MTDFAVVQSHPHLLTYVDSLQKKNAEALSFYPKVVFEREAERGRIFLGLLHGEPCGYLYVGALGRLVRCHQVCIQYDARKRLYGAALAVRMEDYARTDPNCTAIVLRCGFDLEANQFWQSMGYVCVAHHKGGVRRQRTINVWRKSLGPELLDTIGIVPAEGVTDASLWARSGLIGTGSRFHRGKDLLRYRALMEQQDKA